MQPLNTRKLVHEDSGTGLTVHAMPNFSRDFRALLEKTVFGSDGLRYRRLDIADQLARLPDATFLELRRKETLIGTYALASATLEFGATRFSGIYRGLLALDESAQGRGLGQYFLETTYRWLDEQVRDRPTLSWGCIESNNRRSLALLRSLGAGSLGTLQSMIAYRQWPRARVAIEELTAPTTIESAMLQSYDDCGLRFVGKTKAPLYAVTDGDEIIAGARANLTHVDMMSSGSGWDFIYDKLLRRVPAARRRYDPKNFRYLRLSDVVIKAGHERVWGDLLSTLLARHEAHMAMFLLDTRSRTYALLLSAGLFGRFAQSTRQQVDILANPWNIAADQLAAIAERPLAIGPLDI